MHTFSKQNVCGIVSFDDNGRVLPAEKEECLPGQDQVPFLSLELPGDDGDGDDDDDDDDDDDGDDDGGGGDGWDNDDVKEPVELIDSLGKLNLFSFSNEST